MKIIRHIAVAVFAAAVMLSASGCKTEPETDSQKNARLGSGEVLKAGGCALTGAEAGVFWMDLQNQYKRRFGGSINENQKMGDTTLGEYLKDKAESEISIVCAMADLAKERDVTLTKEEEASIAAAANEYFSSLDKAEKKYSGANEDDVSALYRKYLTADKLYAEETDGIGDDVSDEEARVIRILYIFVDTKKNDAKKAGETLENIRKSAADSQTFMTQAGKLSDSKDVEKTIRKNEADEDYEIRAFDLSDGEISGVISQPEGLYLVRCENSYLKEESDANKAQIIRDRRIAAFNQIYSRYLTECDRGIDKSFWDSLTLSGDSKVKADNLFTVYDRYF